MKWNVGIFLLFFFPYNFKVEAAKTTFAFLQSRFPAPICVPFHAFVQCSSYAGFQKRKNVHLTPTAAPHEKIMSAPHRPWAQELAIFQWFREKIVHPAVVILPPLYFFLQCRISPFSVPLERLSIRKTWSPRVDRFRAVARRGEILSKQKQPAPPCNEKNQSCAPS